MLNSIWGESTLPNKDVFMQLGIEGNCFQIQRLGQSTRGFPPLKYSSFS